jgi:hypothetical protein
MAPRERGRPLDVFEHNNCVPQSRVALVETGRGFVAMPPEGAGLKRDEFCSEADQADAPETARTANYL